MRSNVNIADHPVHPMLVLVPVGAWVTSLVLDIVFVASGDTFWFVASFWVIVVGIAGALVAAITGLWDLFTLPMTEEPKRVGLTHMVLNLVITGLYVINILALRLPAMLDATTAPLVTSGTALWALILNIVAAVLLVISGWLGGEMVYRYGIAIPRDTMERSSRYETRRATGETGMAGSLGGEAGPTE